MATRLHLPAAQAMLLKAALQILAILALGATALSTQLGQWQLGDSSQYVFYFGFALLAFSWEVKAPSSGASTNMGYVFVIVALVQLNLRETLQIAACAIFIQSVLRRHEQKDPRQLLNTLLSAGASILASQYVYHFHWLAKDELQMDVRFVLAASACFVAAHLPIAATILLADPRQLAQARRACDFWSFPYHLAAAAAAGAVYAARGSLSWRAWILLAAASWLLYHSFRRYVDRLERQMEHSRRVTALHMRTIEALAVAIEAREINAGSHLRRVLVFALELAKRLRLSGSEAQALSAAALLHDIGKLAIPEHILDKPDRLTPEEFEKVKIHPLVGADILERARFPYPVAPIVRAHHERWDGSGYPAGLKGEEIPMGARILAVADTVNALASERCYRRALPLDEAITQIASLAGKAFDPKVVEILRQNYREWEEIFRNQKSGGPESPSGERTISSAALASRLSFSDRFVQSISLASQEAQAVFSLSQEFGASLHLDHTFEVLDTKLKNLVPFHTLAIYVQRGDYLTAEHVSGDHLALCSSLQIPVGSGLSGWVAANGSPVANQDPSIELLHLNNAIHTSPFSSALSVPLAGPGGLRGALTLYRSDGSNFTSDHTRLVSLVAPMLAAALENGMRFKDAEDSATSDYLTGLPNAHSLSRRLATELARSSRSDAPFAVVLCDLDGFKEVNDRFGHLTGNEVLRAVSEGFQESCRQYDYVARMGGDEFVLLLSGLAPDDLPARIAQMRGMVEVRARRVCDVPMLGASFGAAFYPADGKTPDELLAAADHEMYGNKRERKGTTPPPSVDSGAASSARKSAGAGAAS